MSSDIKYRSYNISVEFLKWVRKQKFGIDDKWIIRQVSRAIASIGANLVEAQSSSSSKEFIRYNEISLKSANESKYWLCLIRDGLEVKDENLKYFIKEINEISKIIAKGIISLKSKEK
jgi:four helix bundle protein